MLFTQGQHRNNEELFFKHLGKKTLPAPLQATHCRWWRVALLCHHRRFEDSLNLQPLPGCLAGDVSTFHHTEISSCVMLLFPSTAALAQGEKRKKPKPVQRWHTIQLSEFIHFGLTSWFLACFIWRGVFLNSPTWITRVLVYILDKVVLVLLFIFFQLRFSPWSGHQHSFVTTHSHGHCNFASQLGTRVQVRSHTCFLSTKQHTNSRTSLNEPWKLSQKLKSATPKKNLFHIQHNHVWGCCLCSLVSHNFVKDHYCCCGTDWAFLHCLNDLIIDLNRTSFWASVLLTCPLSSCLRRL